MIAAIRVGADVYPVLPDGWCPALGCYVYRHPHTGQLVTIPADHPPKAGNP